MFTMSPNDTGNADSVQIHGLSTMFNANDIVKIINGGFKAYATCYPYNM